MTETRTARCGRTNPHGAHATAERPGWCAGNVNVIAERPAVPEWLRRANETPRGLARDLTGYGR